MNKKLTICIGTLVIAVGMSAQKIQYPVTKKVNQVDVYHGNKVPDPYRWLEDDNSAETANWVEAQNKVTNAYLDKITLRTNVRARLQELWNYPKFGSPFKKGKYYFFYKNDGLQNQSVLYRQVGMKGNPEVFLDPNTFSKDGTVALGTVAFSKSGKYAAYLQSQSGSDWQEGYLMDVETKKPLAEKLQYIKFSGLSWKGDEGFYYSRYPEPDEKTKLSRKNEYHKIYYHKAGTPQSQDGLVYEEKDHPLRNVGGGVTEDNRFLFVSTSQGTSGKDLKVRDLLNNQNDFTSIVTGFKTEPSVVDNVGGKILLKTNDGAPNYKVVLVDPKNPGQSNWVPIIPERKEVLTGVGTAGGFLFVSYLKDASTKVYQYTYEGKLVREITLPGIGTAGGFGGSKEDKEFFYGYSSYAFPPSIFKYNVATGQSTLFRKADVKFDPKQFETKQLFFTSKDGARVPMFITHKKGLKLDGNNPVMLYGYGGFNVPQTPGFGVSNLFFIEQGGIYAVVNLRGGSEYGEDWHSAGMLQKKQNVFNDFIGAAEHLVANKYTNPKRIAIRGGSNGGLLVGAAMTQRPELFKVAIPQVGVMDMLRYHKFTIGWAWAVEYGNADSSAADFNNLYKYSPLHNLKDGVSYPATMVTTADHDDRVVPAHSFKFAARLQEAHKGDNPVLIRIESKAGHGAGKPTSKQIDEAADIWSFVMHNLGMDFKK